MNSLEGENGILSEREKKAVKIRRGLDWGGEKTPRDTGKESGLTRERARQIEQEAFAKIRGTRQN